MSGLPKGVSGFVSYVKAQIQGDLRLNFAHRPGYGRYVAELVDTCLDNGSTREKSVSKTLPALVKHVKAELGRVGRREASFRGVARACKAILGYRGRQYDEIAEELRKFTNALSGGDGPEEELPEGDIHIGGIEGLAELENDEAINYDAVGDPSQYREDL